MSAQIVVGVLNPRTLQCLVRCPPLFWIGHEQAPDQGFRIVANIGPVLAMKHEFTGTDFSKQFFL